LIGRRGSQRKNSDSSLDRRSSAQKYLRQDLKMSPRGKSDAKQSSRRLGKSMGSQSEKRKSFSRGKSSGRSSPDFGNKHSESEYRLETFGKREEKSKRIYDQDGLSIKNTNNSRKAKTSHDWKKDGRRRDNNLKPSSAAGSRSRSRNRDPKSGFKDNRLNRSGNFKSERSGNTSYKSSKSGRATSSYDDPRFSKHLSSKMAKKRGKPLNFNEKKEKREKDWMLDYKAHRPILHFSDRFEEPVNRTKSYLISLNGVKGIPEADIPQLKGKGVTPTVIYSCTLYDDRDREFIGRTYSSRPIQLNPGFKETNQNSRDFIFMHTANQDKHLSLIIEAYLEIVELENKNKINYVSLGFGKFELFGDKGVAVATSLPMFRGTPRYLVNKDPFNDFTKHVCSISVQIKEYNILNKIKALIPSSTLCGMNDVIPGIVGGKMGLKRVDNVLCGTEDIILSQLQLDASRKFEDKFERFLEDLIFEKHKAIDELEPKATLQRLGYPRIVERKLYVNYDNTWRSSDEKLFVALEVPKNDSYAGAGHVEVKDFIIDPNTVLIFKIEFLTEIPTDDRKKKEKASFTIAWGYFLPNYNGEGEIMTGPLECELKVGPGMTPDGSILWTPDPKDNDSFIFELSGELDPSGKFDPNSVNKRVREKIPDLRVEDSDQDSKFNFNTSDRYEGDKALPGNNTMSRDLRK